MGHLSWFANLFLEDSRDAISARTSKACRLRLEAGSVPWQLALEGNADEPTTRLGDSQVVRFGTTHVKDLAAQGFVHLLVQARPTGEARRTITCRRIGSPSGIPEYGVVQWATMDRELVSFVLLASKLGKC